MENGKRSAEEVFDGSASPRQHLRNQEDATHDLGWIDLHSDVMQDAPIISDHRADPTQPPRLSSSTIRRPLPLYPRKQINNDDLIASIDQVGYNTLKFGFLEIELK